MTIRNSSVALGATFSPTGGTATSLVALGGDTTTTKTFVGTTGVTPLTRTEISFTGKLAKPSETAPGGFTQGRASLKLTVPKVLANTNRTLNSASVEIALDPETTSVELTAIKSLLINLLNDSDFDQLWLNQSID